MLAMADLKKHSPDMDKKIVEGFESLDFGSFSNSSEIFHLQAHQPAAS
jgi:hypothetical protein